MFKFYCRILDKLRECDNSFAFVCVCVFLGLHLRHMEVPRLGVESELQMLAYTTAIAKWDMSHIYDLHHSLQQRPILNLLSKARD